MRLSLTVLSAILCAAACVAGCSNDTTAAGQAQGTKPDAASTTKPAASQASYAELSAIPARDRSAEQDYQLACAYAQTGRTEDAFTVLADAALKGFADLPRLKADPALANLRSDERWEQVLVFVDVNGAKGDLPDRSADPPKPVQAQRQMPPPAQVNVKAPDWTMADATGKKVKLSDLRGKVVVMDFWATWCGPCKRSMPDIDKFAREHASPDLVVFSVNVWDRSPDVALEFWNQQKYAMTLLFGDRDLTTAYEVQGIPHLCVIDAEGIIRFSQAGYSPQLGDYLVKWTEAARKQG